MTSVVAHNHSRCAVISIQVAIATLGMFISALAFRAGANSTSSAVAEPNCQPCIQNPADPNANHCDCGPPPECNNPQACTPISAAASATGILACGVKTTSVVSYGAVYHICVAGSDDDVCGDCDYPPETLPEEQIYYTNWGTVGGKYLTSPSSSCDGTRCIQVIGCDSFGFSVTVNDRACLGGGADDPAVNLGHSWAVDPNQNKPSVQLDLAQNDCKYKRFFVVSPVRIKWKLYEAKGDAFIKRSWREKVFPDDDCDPYYRYWLIVERPERPSGDGAFKVIAKNPCDKKDSLWISWCGSCAGNQCAPGTPDPKNNSVELVMGLGGASHGHSSGDLRIYSEKPSRKLCSPAGLRYPYSSEHTLVITDGNGDISQVKAPEVLAVVEDPNAIDDGYDIAFYAPEDVTDWTDPVGPWSPSGSATAVSRVRVKSLDGAPDYHVIRFVHFDETGSRSRNYTYTYDDDPNGRYSWTLERAGSNPASPIETEVVEWAPQGGSSVLRTRMVTRDGGVYAKSVDELSTAVCDPEIISRKVYTDASAYRETTFGYYSPDPNGCQSLRSVESDDGSWIYYTYDGQGRLDQVHQPWGDYAPDLSSGVSASLTQYLDYEYSATDPNQHRPIRVDEYALGNLVASTTYSYSYAGGKLTTTERRCSDTGCTNYIETVTTYVDRRGSEVESVEYADGRLESYRRIEGTYADSGAPSAAAFTPYPGGAYERVTVIHGTNSDPNGLSGELTKSVAVTDAGGNTVLSESFTLGVSGHERIDWTVQRFDARGRLLSTHFSNGTSTSQTWSACCGTDTITDELGIVTSISRDLLGRETSRTISYSDSLHEDITTTTSYTISSGARVISTATSHSGSGTDILTSEQQTDLAGQMLSSTDAAGLESTYAYANTDTGGRKVTVTRPGGQTEITCYWRDGRAQVEEGDGVTSRYHTFGAAAGQTWSKTYEGSTDDSSPRWAKTTFDMLGRSVVEERPAFDHGTPISMISTYDTTTGRLLKSEFKHGSTLLIAPTLYEYNEMGEVVRTGLDIGENGTLDLASLDRINDTQSSYVKLSGEWWRETIQKTYRAATSNTPSTVSTVRERLTGLGSGTIAIRESWDAYNNKTVVTSVLTASPGTITETVDLPGTDETEVRVSVEGRLRSVTDRVGLVTSFACDGFGRRVTVTDSRGNPSTTCYEEDTGRMDCSKDGADHETEYTYYTTGSNIGRMHSVTNPAGKHTYYDYDDRGQVTHLWGDVPQPVTMIYDGYGQRTGLVTFRDGTLAWSGATWPTGADPNDGDRTTWTYDEATGLLTQKRYADTNGPDYDYTVDGRLAERQWVRTHSSNRLATTYTYYNTAGANTAELKRIEYDNEPGDAETPDVEYTYTRTGQLSTVSDSVGARTFSYDAYGQRITELFENDPNTCLFPDKLVTTDPDFTITYFPGGGGIGMIVHQYGLAGIKVGTSGSPTADYEAEYQYDGDTARMTRVLGPGLPNNGANYTYRTDSGLIEKIEYKQSSTVQARVTRDYHDDLNLLTLIKNEEMLSGGSPVIVSNYAYAHDELNRRTSVVRTGSAFAASHHDSWSYNARNELSDSLRFNNTDPNSPGSADNQYDRRYRYDPIGNRTKVKTGTDPNEYYCANNLNQYDTIDDTSTCPPTTPDETLTYDLDGNLETDGGSMGASTGRTFTWDGENRLIRVAPTAPQYGDIKVEFAYDYLGRRVEKVVHTWALNDPNDPNDDTWSATPSLHKRWIWHDWLCVMEYDVSAGPTLAAAKKYTWGLDLGGSGENPRIDSAGGIGGLLAVRDVLATPSAKSYYYFYDGNGNVGQLIDRADGSVDAKYEYDAYGNYLTKSGTFANDNPWRFSTKYWDDETGLGYWGYRYYDAEPGRWVSRDPIEELDDLNVVRYSQNRTLDNYDANGMWCNRGNVKRATELVRIQGRVRIYTPSPDNRGRTRWTIESTNLDRLIDFEIYTRVKYNLRVIGPNDDAEFTVAGRGFWRSPTPPELIGGGLYPNNKEANIYGVACRVKEICQRECDRCAISSNFFRNSQYTWTQIGCLTGERSQWRYGVVGDTLGGPGCRLFADGQRFRIGDFARSVQPAPLACTEADVPQCPGSSPTRCYPTDSRWDDPGPPWK